MPLPINYQWTTPATQELWDKYPQDTKDRFFANGLAFLIEPLSTREMDKHIEWMIPDSVIENQEKDF